MKAKITKIEKQPEKYHVTFDVLDDKNKVVSTQVMAFEYTQEEEVVTEAIENYLKTLTNLETLDGLVGKVLTAE